MSVTYDDPSVNLAMDMSLVCHLKDINNIKIWFDHQNVNVKSKVYFLLDACHILKRIKNNLAHLKIMIDPEDN